MLIASAATLFAGILLLYFYLFHSSIKGTGFWGIGWILVSIGSVLYIFYPFTESYFLLVFAATIIVTGQTMYYAGVRAFLKKRINWYVVAGIPVIQFVQATVFNLNVSTHWLRMACFSAILAIISLLTIREFVLLNSKSYGFVKFSAILILSFLGITSLIRVGYVFINRPETLAQAGNSNVVMFLFYGMVQFILLFVFFTMITNELSTRLRKNIEDQKKLYSIIGHDLKSPVGTIEGVLNLINSGALTREEERRFLTELEKTTHTAGALLRNLLMWTKSQMDEFTPVIKQCDLNKIAEENLGIYSDRMTEKGIKLTFKSQNEISCSGDDTMIGTIIRNLVSNAMKFTPENGEVIVNCRQTSKFAEFRIFNSGEEISREQIEIILERKELVTTSGTDGEKGTGIGLLICQEFIDAMNGIFNINSTGLNGVEVIVRMPVND
jgi:signal transduction histidine kinase